MTFDAWARRVAQIAGIPISDVTGNRDTRDLYELGFSPEDTVELYEVCPPTMEPLLHC